MDSLKPSSAGETVFWQQSEIALLARLGSTRDGLSEAEATRRLVRDGPNTIDTAPKRHVVADLRHRIANPLVIILLVAAAIAGATGDIASFINIVVAVVLSTALDLGPIRQTGGKRIDAFAVEQEIDCAKISSNLFELEWPPGSGVIKSFPEIDAARWMTLNEARVVMLESQRPLIDRLGDCSLKRAARMSRRIPTLLSRAADSA